MLLFLMILSGIRCDLSGRRNRLQIDSPEMRQLNTNTNGSRILEGVATTRAEGSKDTEVTQESQEQPLLSDSAELEHVLGLGESDLSGDDKQVHDEGAVEQNTDVLNANMEENANGISPGIYHSRDINRNSSQCQQVQKLGRRYLTLTEIASKGASRISGHSFVPALLYSFPGSGNTWARLLIDWSTGIYTGSFFYDKSLLSVLPGEARCDRSVSAIKGHPHMQTYQNITTGPSLKTGKCGQSTIQAFDKVVFLLRNPFDAIWSEFQRRRSG
jgi:hypothetical protein